MGDHMAVFRSLRELFPQVDTRILKAVAIEHHKDVDSAVVAVLDEVMPSMTGSVGASCALNEALASIADSVGTSSASHVTRETGSSSSAVGGSVDSAKCTSSTEVITDMQENVVGEPDVGRSPSYQGTSEQLSFPSHPVPELNDNQCVLTSELIDRYLNPCSERNSAHSENEVVHGGYIPCEYFAVSLIGENGSDSINLNVAQVQERDSNNTIPVWDCIAQDNNSLKFLCDYAEVNDVNDPFWAKIFAGVSNNEVSTGILSIEKDVFAPVLNFPIPDISESSAGPGGVLEQKDTNSNKQQSGNIVENGDTFLSSKTDLLPDLNLNHFASTASTHSNHSVNIEPLEDSIADAKNNKNDLLPSLELVTKMIEDVALLEEKAKVAKCESSVAGTGIITKVEELKEMLNHAKEANDMHAGEVFGEKSILTTEARELQSQLQRLSDERNSYLVVIEEPEHQQLIVDAGALPLLVNLLKRHKNATNLRAVNSVIRRAADAITNLAHENSNIKTCVRIQGGIPPLVELLESQDLKVQRAAAGALRTLAFDNDENKSQIVDCNALPTLILMLRSEDAAIHYEAVGVIGNLVHSSPNIKKEVLNAGALQPVIGLLSSCCMESQREAALLLGQFASADSDCKVHIVQRGAVRPLIEMLQSADVQLREVSAFALGRLAQDTHNQAGIAYNGGLVPLLKLLDSKNWYLQHNAAFALYGVADNEDYVSDFIKVGGVKKLQGGEFIVQATKDLVAKILKRLEEKINGRVLKHLVYLMRVGEKFVRRRVALALAHLCSPEDQRTIFIDNNGLDFLLDLLVSVSLKHQQDGSVALYKLANKAAALSPMDAAPPSPTPQVYLGEQYVNSSTLSDVTFLVEGKRFYAHRIALLASSDAFRAMFDGGYREKDARDIEIPNIRWDVFELMMRFIYTGSVEVTSDIAQDLLRAADQYRLEGLKRLCEYTIVQDVNLDNVSDMYDLSEAFHAMSLRHTCVLFILEQFEKIFTRPEYLLSLINLDIGPPHGCIIGNKILLTSHFAMQFPPADPARHPGAPQLLR